MKIIHLIILVFCFSSASGQIIYPQNWSEFNLKGSPSYVKEIELVDFQRMISHYYDSPVNYAVGINEYHFDSTGVVIKSISKSQKDSLGRGALDMISNYKHYGDSILVIKTSNSGDTIISRVKYLDNNGFVKYCHSYFLGNKSSLKFIRNDKNEIITIYKMDVGTDTTLTKWITNEYNLNGDLQSQSMELDPEIFKPTKKNSTVTFKYVYDNNDNWIVRIAIIDGENVGSITEREIKY